MADPRIKVRPPSNDPGRPPAGPAGVSTPAPAVITMSPEFMEKLERLVVAFEALVPVTITAETPCGVPIFRLGRRPVLCTRPAGHDPGHVAHREDGTVIVCQLGRPPVPAEGWVCPACGESAQEA